VVQRATDLGGVPLRTDIFTTADGYSKVVSKRNKDEYVLIFDLTST
jgi:hypothetical protein